MGWWQFAVAVIAGLAAASIPGAIVALGMRLRGLWFAAAMPALGITAIFAATYVVDLLSVGWSLLPVVMLAAIAGFGCLLLTRSWPRLRPTRATSRVRAWVAPLAVAITAILIGLRTVYAIGDPAFFAQEFDNVFHLNAVRYVVETSSASPTGLLGLVGSSTTFGYPSAWHAFNALVVQLANVSPVVASNAVLLITGCFIWPLSTLVLTRTLVGPRTSTTLASGVIAAGFAAFPLLPISSYGGYPLVLSIALTPLAFAAGVQAIGIARQALGRGCAALLLLGLLPGLIGAHPSALVWIAFMSLPAAVILTVKHRGLLTSPMRWLIAIMSLVTWFALVFLVVWVATAGLAYGRVSTIPEALGAAATISFAAQPFHWAIALLTIIGVTRAIWLRTAPSLLAVSVWVIALALYVIAAAAPDIARALLVTAWYGSSVRLAAFATVAVVPVAALGATAVWDWTAAVAPRVRRSPTLRVVSGTVLVVVLVAATQLFTLAPATADARRSFQATMDRSSARLAVDADGRAMFEKIAQLVPEGDVIANNPWDGSGFTYAITGRLVLMPHQLRSPGAMRLAILNGLATATVTSEACQAVRDLDVRWVVRFDAPDGLGGGAQEYPGLMNLDESPNVELVERIGTATLYRITGCGL